MKLSEKEFQTIISFLVKNLDPYFMVLFGSVLTDQMRPDSDVDIAFYGAKKLTDYELFMLTQELASLLGRDVDLVNLDKVSTVFQAQIIGKGRLIYDKNKSLRQQFFMLTLKKYARLNEERKEILERIGERGMVYG